MLFVATDFHAHIPHSQLLYRKSYTYTLEEVFFSSLLKCSKESETVPIIIPATYTGTQKMLLFFETNTLCHNQLRALRTAALVYAFFEQSDRGLFVQLSFVKSTLRTNNQYMNIYTTYSNFFTIISSKICPSPLKIRSST